MAIVINVGLLTNTNESLDLDHVLTTLRRELKCPAWDLGAVAVFQSASEPTLVLVIEPTYLFNDRSFGALRADVFHISNILLQDCIAVWDGDNEKGYLIGSNTEAWGAFNHEYFLLPSGQYLADTISLK